MTLSARDMPVLGLVDYGRTLPLAEGEVVLTFDDGPKPPYTNAVLKALANECVRAVFFMVGRQARAHPDVARMVHAAGHTIGTHTYSHPLYRMPPDVAEREIDAGIASVAAALGTSRAMAPFFRFPGLFRTPEAERYLFSRALSSWSIDVDSDDWKRIDSNAFLERTMARLEARRGGIVLMHDIQPVTALTLPALLNALKTRGYRIVHVVPSGAVQPALPGLVATSQPAPPDRPPSVAVPIPPAPVADNRKPAEPATQRREGVIAEARPLASNPFQRIFEPPPSQGTFRWSP